MTDVTAVKNPTLVVLVSSGFYVAATVVAISIFGVIGTAVSDDVKTLSKISVDQTPCGTAVPQLADLMYGLGMKDYPWNKLPDSGASFVSDVTGAMCKKDSFEASVRVLYQRVKTIEATEDGVVEAVCDRSALDGYKMLSLHPPLYVDPQTRLVRAYMRASSAFHHYNKNSAVGGRCAWVARPFSAAATPTTPACARAADIDAELAAAAVSSIAMVDNTVGTLPTVTEMATRLLMLATLAYKDRTDNGGKCFKNTLEENPDVLCNGIFDDVSTGVASSAPPHAFEFLYEPANHPARQCTEETERMPPPSPPPSPEAQYGEYESTTASVPSVVRHCIRTHEFSNSDLESLFGLPDFQREGAVDIVGTGVLGQLGSQIYKAMHEAWYVDQRKVEVLTSPRRDAMLFAAYRLGATFVWLIPAFACTAYWLARGAVPIVAIGLPILLALIKGTTEEEVRLERPKPMTLHWVAVLVTALVFLYMVTVDPVVASIYQRDDCDDYDDTGMVWGISTKFRTTGLVAVAFITFIAAFVVVYEVAIRKSHHGRLPRISGFSLTFALIAIVVMLLFDVLLLVDSVDKWVAQLQDFTDNEAELEAQADVVLHDASVLITTTTMASFAFGACTMRWAVLYAREIFKWLWVVAAFGPMLIAYLTRTGLTADELSESHKETGYSARQASYWTSFAVLLLWAIVVSLFFDEARNVLTAEEMEEEQAIEEAIESHMPLMPHHHHGGHHHHHESVEKEELERSISPENNGGADTVQDEIQEAEEAQEMAEAAEEVAEEEREEAEQAQAEAGIGRAMRRGNAPLRHIIVRGQRPRRPTASHPIANNFRWNM